MTFRNSEDGGIFHPHIRMTVWHKRQWTQKASDTPHRASLIVMDGNLRYILAHRRFITHGII